MSKYAKILGKNVDRLFQQSAKTQEEFAKIIGLTQTRVSAIIRGKIGNPTIGSLEKIAGPFGKDVVWLLTDHDRPSPYDHDLAECKRRVDAAFQRGLAADAEKRAKSDRGPAPEDDDGDEEEKE